MKYKNLFNPLEIRGNVYRNRIINAPTLFAHSIFTFPEIKENVYRMVENRAKGGSAAVSTGEISVNAEEALCLFLDRSIDFTDYDTYEFEAIKEYSDRIKRHGALSYLEFCHEGAFSEAKPPHNPWGPIEFTRDDGVKVLAFNEERMKKVEDDFYNISNFAREAGFDGVLLHGGHGFLIQQFISNTTNKRTDQYGGSMENKAKFPIRLIEAVRRGIGDDKIIELRISAEDGDGEMTIDDTVEFCKLIDGKVDIIHVSNGLKWAGNRTQTFSDFFDIHGVNVEHARKIKKVVNQSKVAVIGGINSPEQAEEIIASGAADFVELGRQGFADPEFANKAKNGRSDDIRKCVRCFNCYPGFCEHDTDIPLSERLPEVEVRKIYSPTSMGVCAVNPNSGFGHYEDRYPEVKSRKRVLIIGAGPGGMEAAIEASKRGHEVLLLEKNNKMGGILKLCDIDHDKKDLGEYKDLLIRLISRDDNIEVRLNTEFSKDILLEFNPDNVIIAIGAKSKTIDIKGIENAIPALSVYNNDIKLGHEVVLIGGGLVGCEVGLYLASLGKKVSVIEQNKMMAPETFGYYRNALLEEMDKRSIIQYKNAICKEIKDNGVVIELDDVEQFVSCNSVVYSLGMEVDYDKLNKVIESLEDIDYEIIGDAEHIGKVVDASHSGYQAALKII